MSFECDRCFEECGDHELAHWSDYGSYCDFCWQKVKPRIEAEKERNKRSGHTGSDLCGCEMCAARADAG
jgi:hypothetical protein